MMTSLHSQAERASRLWTPQQLQAMRGLNIPAWVGGGLNVPSEAPAPQAKTFATPVSASPTLTQTAPPLISPQAMVAVTTLQPLQPLQPLSTLAPVMATISAPDTSRLDWTELTQSARLCHACALGSTDERMPLGIGNQSAIKGGVFILLDAADNEPHTLLSEAANALLLAILASVGLTLDTQVYVTSTLKCATKTPLNALGVEISSCAPFLERQIVLKQSPLIIAMGQGAAQCLMGLEEPLAALRGELHDFECEGYAGRLLVTHHPKALLETSGLKREVWDDLCIAIEAGLLANHVGLKNTSLRSK